MDQVRCDCGALVRADAPAQRLAALIDHVRVEHGTSLSAEFAELVLTRRAAVDRDGAVVR